MGATNIRLRLSEAAEVDPDMMVSIRGEEDLKAERALANGSSKDSEITTARMKAKDAAQYCLLCAKCEKSCPVKLPIMNIIEDLRANGKFKR